MPVKIHVGTVTRPMSKVAPTLHTYSFGNDFIKGFSNLIEGRPSNPKNSNPKYKLGSTGKQKKKIANNNTYVKNKLT